MRFGMTKQEKETWQPYYAWLPVKTIDHQWVWLEKVERISYFAGEIRVSAPISFFGAWCYRTIDKEKKNDVSGRV